MTSTAPGVSARREGELAGQTVVVIGVPSATPPA